MPWPFLNAGNIVIALVNIVIINTYDHIDLTMNRVSSIFHFECERIHQFSDGNGRTGRLWHSLILQR